MKNVYMVNESDLHFYNNNFVILGKDTKTLEQRKGDKNHRCQNCKYTSTLHVYFKIKFFKLWQRFSGHITHSRHLCKFVLPYSKISRHSSY